MSREQNHFSLQSIIILLGLILGFQAFGRDFIYQSPDTEELYQVLVQNKSRQLQQVWVLFYEDEYLEEHYFEVPARTTKNIRLDGLKKPNWNFAILTKSSQVVPVSSSHTWESNHTSRFEMKIKSQQAAQFKFFNLYLRKQKVVLTYLDAFGKILDSKEFYTAAFRQSLSRLEEFPTHAKNLIIESEAPVQITSQEIFKPVISTSRKVSSDYKYFLVQNGTDGTNFVAPMKDPAMILQARKEILNPQGYIVFADIELNSQQANRNFANPEKSYWSWSIKEVTGLAQIGADWCQAYPEMIERMLHGFLRQQSVCFRGQRIIRELKPSEVESGVLNP